MTRNEQRLCDALDELLTQTVDQGLAAGVELTEAEMTARSRAIQLIEEMTGETNE